LLSIPVGKKCALRGDTVDVWGVVAHHATVIGADVELADVIAPDNKDVWFFSWACPSKGRADTNMPEANKIASERITLDNIFTKLLLEKLVAYLLRRDSPKRDLLCNL